MRTELKEIQRVLRSDYPECLESQREDEEVLEAEDEEQRSSSREALLNISLHLLRSMKQEELAERLQSSKRTQHMYHDGESLCVRSFPNTFDLWFLLCKHTILLCWRCKIKRPS